MGDIGLLKQGWNWLRSQKQAATGFQMTIGCTRERFVFFMDQHWPVLYSWCVRLGRFLLMLALHWRDSIFRGIGSLLGLKYTALFVIMWSGFLSLTSTSYLFVVVSILGASGATVHYLGYTPGLFVVGIFGVLLMWQYGNIWITGMLFIPGGYMFFLNHARPLIFMTTVYSVYCAFVRVGWLGIFLSLNLAFVSNDLLNKFLQGYDHVTEGIQPEEYKDSEPVAENSCEDTDFFTPSSEAESFSTKKSCKVLPTSNPVNITKNSSCSAVSRNDTSSVDEMKRIMNSANHYEVLGFSKSENIDQAILKREYRRKAMLVHPDKNMGIPLADESFKKIQCAYEVLSDLPKKMDYDERLRKEESKSVCQTTYATTQRSGIYWSEESRHIDCTKCGNSHLWICTTRCKASARWCQDCRRHHPAKDGDGWVEYENSTATSHTEKFQ